MNSVIVRDRGSWKLIPLEEFKKDYGITPKCVGESFIIVQRDQHGELYTYKFPNPACIFIDGSIKYIIYKGDMEYIVNGHRMPNAEFVDENQVFANEDEFHEWINDRNNHHESWIDLPNGERLYVDRNVVFKEVEEV